MARSVTAVFLQQSFIYGVSLLTFGVFARFLSVDQMGLYAFLYVALYFLAYAGNIGLKKIMIRLTSSHKALGEQELMRRAFWTSSTIGLIPILAFSFIVIHLMNYLRYFDVSNPDIDPLLFLIAMIIFSSRYHLSGGMEGLKRFERLSIYGAGSFTLRRVIAMFLVTMGGGVTGILIAWLVGEGLCLALVLREVVKDYSRPLLGYDLKTLFNQSGPMFIADLSSVLVEWGDRAVVAIFGLGWLAFFHVAASGNTFLSTATMAVYVGVLPYLSEAYHSDGGRGLVMRVKELGRYVVLFSAPLAIGGAALAYPLIDLIVGPTYMDAAPIFMLMAIGVWLSTPSTLIQSALIAAGLTREVMYATVAGTLLEITVFVGLAGVYGLVSAGLGRALLLVSTFILCLFFMHRKMGLEMDWSAVWKAYLSSFIMGVVAYYLWEFIRKGVWFVLAYSVLLPLLLVISLIVYVVCLRLLRVARVDEVAMLYRSLPSRFRVVVRLISLIMGLDYGLVREEAMRVAEEE